MPATIPRFRYSNWRITRSDQIWKNFSIWSLTGNWKSFNILQPATKCRGKVLGKTDEKRQRHLELMQAKGTYTWLKSLPSKQQGRYFSREEFKDAIHLKYGWGIRDLRHLCECGKENSSDHAMTCQPVGF